MLTGWKEIGQYLSVDARTAQRWEAEYDLPVQRMPGIKGRVIADPAELDRWREATFSRTAEGAAPEAGGLPGPFAPVLRYATIGALGLALVGVGFVLGRMRPEKKGPPAAWRLAEDTLIVTDAGQRELWRYRFPEALNRQYYADSAQVMRFLKFVDLYEDGRTETLFKFRPQSVPSSGERLYCFSQSGMVEWTFVPGRRVSDATEEYSSVYLMQFFVLPNRTGHGPAVVVSAQHAWSYPNQVTVLNAQGNVLGEYWHSGHLTQIAAADLDGDGHDELLLGGVDNGRHAATLVVLDPEHLSGASTQPAGDPTQLQGFPRGAEKAVVLFPRSCLSSDQEYDQVVELAVDDEGIRVEVRPAVSGHEPQLVFVLDRHLSAISVTASDTFKNEHRRLERENVLHHALSDAEINQLKALTVLRGPRSAPRPAVAQGQSVPRTPW